MDNLRGVLWRRRGDPDIDKDRVRIPEPIPIARRSRGQPALQQPQNSPPPPNIQFQGVPAANYHQEAYHPVDTWQGGPQQPPQPHFQQNYNQGAFYSNQNSQNQSQTHPGGPQFVDNYAYSHGGGASFQQEPTRPPPVPQEHFYQPEMPPQIHQEPFYQPQNPQESFYNPQVAQEPVYDPQNPFYQPSEPQKPFYPPPEYIPSFSEVKSQTESQEYMKHELNYNSQASSVSKPSPSSFNISVPLIKDSEMEQIAFFQKFGLEGSKRAKPQSSHANESSKPAKLSRISPDSTTASKTPQHSFVIETVDLPKPSPKSLIVNCQEISLGVLALKCEDEGLYLSWDSQGIRIYDRIQSHSSSPAKSKRQRERTNLAVQNAGPPSEKYRCYKCQQPGHWIRNCPLNIHVGENMEHVKKSTGIPRSFMVRVDGPDVLGAMMTPDGIYAIPSVNQQAYMDKNMPKPSDSKISSLFDQVLTQPSDCGDYNSFRMALGCFESCKITGLQSTYKIIELYLAQNQSKNILEALESRMKELGATRIVNANRLGISKILEMEKRIKIILRASSSSGSSSKDEYKMQLNKPEVDMIAFFCHKRIKLDYLNTDLRGVKMDMYGERYLEEIGPPIWYGGSETSSGAPKNEDKVEKVTQEEPTTVTNEPNVTNPVPTPSPSLTNDSPAEKVDPEPEPVTKPSPEDEDDEISIIKVVSANGPEILRIPLISVSFGELKIHRVFIGDIIFSLSESHFEIINAKNNKKFKIRLSSVEKCQLNGQPDKGVRGISLYIEPSRYQEESKFISDNLVFLNARRTPNLLNEMNIIQTIELFACKSLENEVEGLKSIFGDRLREINEEKGVKNELKKSNDSSRGAKRNLQPIPTVSPSVPRPSLNKTPPPPPPKKIKLPKPVDPNAPFELPLANIQFGNLVILNNLMSLGKLHLNITREICTLYVPIKDFTKDIRIPNHWIHKVIIKSHRKDPRNYRFMDIILLGDAIYSVQNMFNQCLPIVLPNYNKSLDEGIIRISGNSISVAKTEKLKDFLPQEAFEVAVGVDFEELKTPGAGGGGRKK